MELGGQDSASLMGIAAALLAAGAGAGLLAGLLGVGGGIVMVPALYAVSPLVGVADSVQMHMAVATSLAAMIPTSVVSIRSHNKKRAVDWRLLRLWTPSIVVGVLIGAYLGGRASGTELKIFFGVAVLLVSMNMAVRGEGKVFRRSFPDGVVRIVMGLMVGIFSVIMGIGGATFSVPMMTACDIPIRRAVGTASAIGFCVAVPGAVGFVLSGLGNPDLPRFALGYVNIPGVAAMIPATTALAPVGAKIAHSINPGHLRLAFSGFLFMTGARMLYTTFF